MEEAGVTRGGICNVGGVGGGGWERRLVCGLQKW